MPDNAISLIAAKVKSFDSGDSNRDLHMIQVPQGAKFPIVSVRLQLPEVALSSSTIVCDLHFQYAGQTAHTISILLFSRWSREMSIALREPFHPRSRTSRFLRRRSLRSSQKRNACEGGYHVASAVNHLTLNLQA